MKTKVKGHSEKRKMQLATVNTTDTTRVYFCWGTHKNWPSTKAPIFHFKI